MALTQQTPYNNYTGNGSTTVFAYTFKLFLASDLKVYLDGVLQIETTHYTVSGVGTESGGNVTFVAAPASSVAVQLVRSIPYNRLVDYQTSGDLLANTLDDDIDRVVAQVQQLEQAAVDSVSAPLPGTDYAASGRRIVNLADPVNAQDAVTKAHLDAQVLAATIPDGNKGNITVSNSGATWTVNDGDITNAKLAFDGGALAGYRNMIINGESLVSTRGTGTIACPAGVYTYTTDCNIVNPIGAAVTAQQSSALVAPGHNSGLVVNNAAGLTQVQFGQRIASQNSRHAAGGYVAVQFWLYQNSGATVTIGSEIYRANSADVFGAITSDAVVTLDSTTLPTATWKQFKGYALLTAAATTGLYALINAVGTLSSGTTIITGFQVEQGATCTPYEYRPRSVEQMLCYPYLPHVRAIGGSMVGMGQCYDTSTADILVPLVMPPRVLPTGLTIASAGHYTLSAPGSAVNTCNSVTFNGANYSVVKIRATLSAPTYPLSAGNITIMSETNTGATIFFTGCEL